MYCGVPQTTSERVSPGRSLSRILAMPKSSTVTKSRSSLRCSTMMFSGLRSRWTTLCACASPSAASTCAMMWQRRSSGSGHSSRSTALEILSLHVLHGDEERPVALVAPEVEHLDAVRVVEAAGRLRLALEASHHREVFEQRRPEHLEADRAIESEVAGAVDLAHAALADHLLELEAARHHLADQRIALPRFEAEPEARATRSRLRKDGAAIGARPGRPRRQRASALRTGGDGFLLRWQCPSNAETGTEAGL